MMKENLKRAFTILHVQCTGSLLTNLGGVASMNPSIMTKT